MFKYFKFVSCRIDKDASMTDETNSFGSVNNKHNNNNNN